MTRNSSGDEIANVNFLYDDIVHVLQNTIDSCINSATDRRGYVLEVGTRTAAVSVNAIKIQKFNSYAKMEPSAHTYECVLFLSVCLSLCVFSVYVVCFMCMSMDFSCLK